MTESSVKLPAAPHLEAMGYLIERFAFAESTLGIAIIHLMNLGASGQLVIATIGYIQKRDLMRVLAGGAANPQHKITLNESIDLIDSARKLRDRVAHGIWKGGRKEGHVKPISVSVKGALKLLGLSHNEQEYSSADFRRAGDAAHNGAVKLLNFLESVGLQMQETPPPDDKEGC